jgi:palmitoyltransferase ZDHHC4
MASPSTSHSFRPSNGSFVVDDVFDDACDLGQFFLNPCWYIFVKSQKLVAQLKASPTNDDDDVAATKARKTKFLSNIQQVFYVTSFAVSWAVIFSRAYPLIKASPRTSNVHTSIGYLIFVSCIGSWIMAKTTSPGNITKETMSRFSTYPYDGVLYHPTICPILGIRKLARSKYDRFSKTHVPRFDHYCGWLGQTIGEENHRYFLAFVVSHHILFTYGATFLFHLLRTEATAIMAMDVSQSPPGFSLDMLVAMACFDRAITSICILCCILAIPALDMVRFHMMLLSNGMTTNEYYKWKALMATAKETSGLTLPSKPVLEDVERRDDTHALVRPPDLSAQQFYNLGLVGNIHEVLFPRSCRKVFKKDS